MVQNRTATRPSSRGRPRAYDAQLALQRATEAFWRAGYAGTSMEALTAATGMNKPSLYAAFGDKRSLYFAALKLYWQTAFASMRKALSEPRNLEDALLRVYDGALSIYFAGDGSARGCFVVGTAVTEAAEDREIRSSLLAGFLTFDNDFEARFRTAREQGQLRGNRDPAALAILATATLHTIAIRARAGVPRARLRELARKSVAAICD
jgi:AcrR family transcriptional regulator